MQDRRPPALQNLLATHGRTIHLGQSLPKRDVRVTSVYPSISDMTLQRREGRKGPEAAYPAAKRIFPMLARLPTK